MHFRIPKIFEYFEDSGTGTRLWRDLWRDLCGVTWVGCRVSCARALEQLCTSIRARLSSLASVLTMRRGVTQKAKADYATVADYAAETDRTEVYHPFTMIPANARTIFVWAVACILKLLRSIQRDDRKAVRSECEKVISAIDAEVRSPYGIWIRRLESSQQ